MNKSDTKKIIKLISAAKNVYYEGNMKGIVATNNRCNYINESDLIVINAVDPVNVINILSVLSHDCTIFVCNFSSIKNNNEIINFLDDNYSSYQYGRQMLVDGVREESLLIRRTNKKDFTKRDEEITIFLILKTGGDTYTSKYVNATATNIRNYISRKHEIVCITDNFNGITSVDRCIKMQHSLPKWWGKLEMFREDVTKNNHCLYIDLDTVCIKNIDFLCDLPIGFFGIRDFYNLDVFQTGLMKWDVTGETINIYHQGIKEINRFINKGDHEFIGSLPFKKDFIQDEFPGEICSYKKHMAHLYKNYIDPSIICFHGTPRPHTIKHSLITDHWNY